MEINKMDENNCLFCKIARKEVSAEFIYEDENVVAFLDLNPTNEGHTLVVPRRHSTNLHDMDEETVKQLFVVVKKLADPIKEGVDAEGINIGMNNGGVAGQLIMHSHVHIIPRFSGDGFRHWHGKQTTSEELRKTADKLKEMLG